MIITFFKKILSIFINSDSDIEKDKVINGKYVTMVWGQKVSQTFRNRAYWIALDLDINIDYLMSLIAFESAETFSAGVKNAAGSGATGLIQFMPATAISLGTTTDALSKMTAEDQLNWVYKYLLPYKGRVKTLSDLYMAVLWPRAVGEPDNYVLFRQGTVAYLQNSGLDINKDGLITKADASAKVKEKLERGELYAWSGYVYPYD
ncbi:hypothetical protein AAEX37_01012 [Oligella sp. MSHR50489EDL]|uniref:hypothetical protein n=1 Tax=Oligella sp. MSHR50489EDL TaxID=3139409 RepID=UPI003D814CA1